MKTLSLRLLAALFAALPTLAAPISSPAATSDTADVGPWHGVDVDVADVATVLIGVAEKNKRDSVEASNSDSASTADVATVLLGIADEKRHAAPPSTADVATVLIGVASKRDGLSKTAREPAPAVKGAYAAFVEEAEAHPEDVLG
ncbi:hypothetical protein BDV95DRAFT_670464 [Massariosphaeria phaeospora]|uniref:Uncharacterized protein n=1 Tax=Massariosphaeria phaeospora TaxID=100035 RepID=A0A7C8M4D7_9PLEO|nr:hypothetical protein BDV95DRAFT_670464 [Massariosphaeria phaeospora]